MITFRIKLKSVSSLSIGWSHPVVLGPDIPLMRKLIAKGEGSHYSLYIPGSSLKGALRSSASRVASAYGFTSCGEVKPESVGKESNLCHVCRLFGIPRSGSPSPIFISDLEPTDSSVEPYILTRVRLDDNALKASEKALFSTEYYPQGTEFSGDIILNDTENMRPLIGLLLLSIAELRLGRFGRSSLVDLKLEKTEELRRIVEDRWLDLLKELERWLWSED